MVGKIAVIHRILMSVGRTFVSQGEMMSLHMYFTITDPALDHTIHRPK